MAGLGATRAMAEFLPGGRFLVDANRTHFGFGIRLLTNTSNARELARTTHARTLSLLRTVTHFRNAISHVELHLVAPKWLHVDILLEQSYHSWLLLFVFVSLNRTERTRSCGRTGSFSPLS